MASTLFFTTGMVGQAIMLTSPADGKVYRCKILVRNSAGSVTCRPDITLPADMQHVSFSDWSLGTKTVTGLSYLEGEQVSVLADGSVVSSLSNENTSLTVSGGEIVLPDFYAYVRVGLPYLTDVRTLDFDTPQAPETAEDKMQLTNRLALYIQETRGLWAGSLPPKEDTANPLEGLKEYKSRESESMGDTPEAKTGIIIESIEAKFLYGGGVFVRQVDPLPMTILSIVPAGKYALGGGSR